MSGSLSIFQKLCPSCASCLPVGVARCDCGHLFEADGSGGASADDISLRDEELYENYLVARATQAQEAARVAQDALTEDPDNPEKMSAAELAREVAQSILSDLVEQRVKVAALRATVPIIAAPRAPTPPIEKLGLAASSQPIVASLTVSPVQVTATQKSAPTPAALSPKLPATPPPKVSLPPVTVPRKAVAALEALKHAKARELVDHAQSTAPAATAIPEPKIASDRPADAPTVTTPTVTNIPPATFRAEQAAKADKVMDTHKTAVTQGKECPNCTASVPTSTTRCRCGFVFASGGNDLPTLTLCTGDFTALRNSLNLHLRGRH